MNPSSPRARYFFTALILCTAFLSTTFPKSLEAATFTVNLTGNDDDGDCNGASSDCTLHEAIDAANVDNTPDDIQFNLGAGIPFINVTSGLGALPDIIQPVSINGNTGGATRVELNGAGLSADGLSIMAAGSTIQNLVIDGFLGNGISLLGVSGNTVSGNVISGNGQNGIQLLDASNNTIQGNFIGVNSSGAQVLGNTNFGISIFGTSTNNLLGGSGVGQGNLISGNNDGGISLSFATTTSNTIQGNFIGTDVTGTLPLGNDGFGIRFIAMSSDNLVGGINAGEGNLIAFNNSNGVLVSSGSSGIGILSNRIFSNTGFEIDLNSGFGNNGQTAPVFTSAISAGGTTTLQGTLMSNPLTNYRIEFFSSDTCANLADGEGETFIDAITVMTDGSGNANIQHSFPTPAGSLLSATATDQSTNINDTSQFSPCIATVGAGTLQFSSPTFSLGEDGGIVAIAVIRTGGTGGTVTVNFSTSDGTALAGSDYTANAGTLTWGHTDASSKSIFVTVLDDALVEGDETINLTLSNPTGGAVLGNPNSAVLTLTDDEMSPPPPPPPGGGGAGGGGNGCQMGGGEDAVSKAATLLFLLGCFAFVFKRIKET